MKWPADQYRELYAQYIAHKYPHLAKYSQGNEIDILSVVNDLAGRVAWLERWMEGQGFFTEANIPQFAKNPLEEEKSNETSE